MERIRLIVNSMLLDIMGSASMVAEGVLQIQNVLLEKLRDRFREFAKGVASEIATSPATTDREKAEIRRIMRRMEAPSGAWPTDEKALLKILEAVEAVQALGFGEEEVAGALTELEKLGLVEEVPPPEPDDLPPKPACADCHHLTKDTFDPQSPGFGLNYCLHPDAKGVADTTENTGYVTGVQPRKQPSWCPLLLKKDPPATENSADSLDPTNKPEE